ncbi:MAG: hypothetical protein ACOYK9_01640 [Chlamydiia bacterium]
MAFAESFFVEEERKKLKQNAAVKLIAYAKALVQVARLRKKSTVLVGVCFLIPPKPSLKIYASDARNVVVGFNPSPKKLESSNPHFAESVIQNLLAKVIEEVCFLNTPKPSLKIYASDAHDVVVGFNRPLMDLESSNPHFAKSVIQNLLANESSGWENSMPSVSENFSASESSDGENSMPDHRI